MIDARARVAPGLQIFAKELAMNKALAAIVAVAALSGFGAMRLASSTAPAPSSQSAVLAVPGALTLDRDTQGCDAAAVSQDAASCSAGGWIANETCCAVSGQSLERWHKGSSIKCCGACFLEAQPGTTPGTQP
jgi:hypothetical protein